VCVCIYSARLRLGIFNFVLFSGIKESASRDNLEPLAPTENVIASQSSENGKKHLTYQMFQLCWWVIFWFIHPVLFNHVCKFSPIFVRDVSKSSWEKNVRIILFIPFKKMFCFSRFQVCSCWLTDGDVLEATRRPWLSLSLHIYIPLSRTIGDAFDLPLNTYTHSQRITKQTKLLYSGKRRLMWLKQKEMATTIAAAVQHYLDDY
jgi:hypothetical protein